MNIRNTKEDYGSVSKILHWLIGFNMIGLIAIGWYMTRLSDEDIWYWRLLELHQAVGLSFFVLVPVKFAWKMYSPNPGLLPSIKPWERFVARLVHWFFIVAIVVIPLTGFIFVATNGEAVKLYDLITIPDIGRLSKVSRSLLSNIHYYLSYTCAALIVVHILAALKHHFIDLDRSLRRMTF